MTSEPAGRVAATDAARLAVFRLHNGRYALPIEAIEYVVRAVAVTPLPGAPPIVVGVVDVRGELWPVIDVRSRFGMPPRAIRAADWFLLARTAAHRLILVVDEVEGVIQRSPGDLAAACAGGARTDRFPGAVLLKDGIAWVHDLEKFLTVDEAGSLDVALDAAEQRR